MSESTNIDESIPMSYDDFEAQLTLALASLEGCSATELTNEAIAEHLLEASDHVSEPGFIMSAQTKFTKVKVIKVTKESSPNPIVNGTTRSEYYMCFASTRGLEG